MLNSLVTAARKGGSIGVIGGGVSGLSFAYFLTKLRPDLSITIFEAKPKTGGWIDTVRLHNEYNNKDIVFEKGPRTLRGVSDGTLLMLDMLKSLGYENQVMIMKSSSVANRKYLMDSNYQLVPVPHSLKSFVQFFTSELFNGVVGGVLKEPFIKAVGKPGADESIESFINRRFGSTRLSDKVLSAILHGIYAGDVSKLSVNSVLPRMKESETNDGSIIKPALKSMFSYLSSKEERERRSMKILPEALKQYEQEVSKRQTLLQLAKALKGYPIVSLQDSLDFFPKALTQELIKNPNIKIIYNSKITEVNPENASVVCDGDTYTFDHIRSTVIPKKLSDIIRSSSLKQEFDKVDYVSVFMANIYCSNGDLIDKTQQGFGFLVPKASKNKEFLLGTIFDSDISGNVNKLVDKEAAPELNSFTNMTMMLGGHFYDAHLPSNHLSIKAVRNSLAKIFNVDLTKTQLIIRDEANTDNKTVTVTDKDILISYNLHQDCIPQYNVGYEENKARVHEILKNQYHGKMSVGGMCYGNGIGVPDCVMNSLEAAIAVGKS